MMLKDTNAHQNNMYMQIDISTRNAKQIMFKSKRILSTPGKCSKCQNGYSLSDRTGDQRNVEKSDLNIIHADKRFGARPLGYIITAPASSKETLHFARVLFPNLAFVAEMVSFEVGLGHRSGSIFFGE